MMLDGDVNVEMVYTTPSLRYSLSEQGIPSHVVQRCKEHISKEWYLYLGERHKPHYYSAEHIKLTDGYGTKWSSEALGCPEEGMYYTQRIVPGFVLHFVAVWPYVTEEYFTLHTNEDGSIIRLAARRGQAWSE